MNAFYLGDKLLCLFLLNFYYLKRIHLKTWVQTLDNFLVLCKRSHNIKFSSRSTCCYNTLDLVFPGSVSSGAFFLMQTVNMLFCYELLPGPGTPLLLLFIEFPIIWFMSVFCWSLSFSIFIRKTEFNKYLLCQNFLVFLGISYVSTVFLFFYHNMCWASKGAVASFQVKFCGVN